MNEGGQAVRIPLDDALLEYATPRQAQVFLALKAAGNAVLAGEQLGIGGSEVRSCMSRLRRRAARRGYAPDHDMDKTAPDGFQVGQTWTRYNQHGEVVRQTVHVKQDKEREMQAWLEAVRDLAEEYRGSAEPIDIPAVGTDGKDCLNVWGIGDMHVGMLAHGLETHDGDFDLKIAQSLYESAFRRASLMADAEECLLVFAGDNFHMNDSRWVTPGHGHRLDGDSRYQEVIRVGAKLVRWAIECALRSHEKVRVWIMLGNHDFDASAGLALAISLLFENEPRVEVDTTPGRFHYYRFGQVLLGGHHGDTTKPAKLPMVMANQRKEDWGETQWKKWYCGHIHHERVRDIDGVEVHSLANLSPKDAYAAEHGYHSNRKMIIDVWHREDGYQRTHGVGV